MASSLMLTAYFDGGSRGNPGVGGAGWVVMAENTPIIAGMQYCGANITNNEAEYAGVIGALAAVVRHVEQGGSQGATLVVRGDSKLVISQLTDVWKCRATNLAPLLERAKELKARLCTMGVTVEAKWIPRSTNAMADKLANMAMDTTKSETDLSLLGV